MKKLFTFMALLSLSAGAWAEDETTTTEKDTTYIVDWSTGKLEEEKDTFGIKNTGEDGTVTYGESWWNDNTSSSAYIIPRNYTLTLTFNNYTNHDSTYSAWYISGTSLFATNNITDEERYGSKDYFGYNHKEFIAATLDGRGTSPYSQEGYPDDFAAKSDSLDSAKVVLTIANYEVNVIAKAEITTRNGSTMKISWIEDKNVLNDTLRIMLHVDSCYVDGLSSQLVDSVEESFYEGLQLSKAVPYVEDGIAGSTVGTSNLDTSWWTAFSDWYIVPKEYELTISFTNHCSADTATIAYDKYTNLTAVMVCGSEDQDNEYIGLTNTGWEWKCIQDTLEQIQYNNNVKELAETLNGSTITVTVDNAEDSLSVKMVIVKNDTTMTQVVKREIPDTISTVYARLIPANSYLTDITSSMKYTRANSGQGAYGTVCMPFDATVGNAKAYEVVGYGTDASGDPETLYLDEVSYCEAGKGYVFQSTSTDSIVFNVTGTTRVDEPSEGALVGNFVDSLAVDSCDYILTTSTSSYVWGKGKGNYIKRYRAYLDSAYVFDTNNFADITSNNAAAKGYIMFSIITDGDDNTTGIQEIVSDGQNGEADDVIYNLSGIRVTNPQKGIYIRNGKKYIIK